MAGPSVELLYITGCPHFEAFLPHLRGLLRSSGITSAVQLIEIADDGEADRRQFLGSPTLRVDGVDVDRSAACRTDYGVQCRLYLTEDGTRGTPPDSWVLEAIDTGPKSDASSRG